MSAEKIVQFTEAERSVFVALNRRILIAQGAAYRADIAAGRAQQQAELAVQQARVEVERAAGELRALEEQMRGALAIAAAAHVLEKVELADDLSGLRVIEKGVPCH